MQNLTSQLQALQDEIEKLNQEIQEINKKIFEVKAQHVLDQNSLPNEVATELRGFEAPKLELEVPKIDIKINTTQISQILNRVFKLD